jgi:lipoprotein-anchoring transpeptidase ErfK/SrfK
VSPYDWPQMSASHATRPARRAGAVLLPLAGVIALAGCGRAQPTGTPAPATTAAAAAPAPRAAAGPIRLGQGRTYAALAATNVTVRSRPGAGEVVGLFMATLPWGSPTPFLVQGVHRGARGATWFKVLLPRRPNGSTGWIRRDQVRLVGVERHAEVDLSDRTLRLYRGDRVEQVFRVGVGEPGTPTPTGHFFVTVKLRPPQISPVYGAWALGLSAYSPVLDQFGTGDGQIALHGTANPGDLGRAVSHGCVRLDNQAISSLAEQLPIGAPVTIRA